jgi:hypothetical protein
VHRAEDLFVLSVLRILVLEASCYYTWAGLLLAVS